MLCYACYQVGGTASAICWHWQREISQHKFTLLSRRCSSELTLDALTLLKTYCNWNGMHETHNTFINTFIRLIFIIGGDRPHWSTFYNIF